MYKRQLFGTRSFLLNNEIRFPLLEGVVLGFPFGNIGLPGVQGALFADVGNAWDQSEGAFPRPFGSFGVGLRSSLGGLRRGAEEAFRAYGGPPRTVEGAFPPFRVLGKPQR